jgi:DNA-binding NarL/FixJ family response regulator
MNTADSCCPLLIVDDHDIVCTGVISLLKKHQPCYDVDYALNYEELMALISSKKYKILILDLNLGKYNSMHIIRELTDKYPFMKILVLSMYPEDPYALQCINEGARGYVNKKNVTTELIPALEKISQNKIYCSYAYENTLLLGTKLSKKNQPSLSSLSQREFEIYNLIISGMSFKDIAHKLNISAKTVSAHHANILQKLSLSNTMQLFQYAFQHSGTS